ncbi:MAG: DUF3800 domain-containing protein [Phycisphaerales bacterium]
MDVTFLFLDESRSTHLDTASLTGVFVPADHYARVRDAFLVGAYLSHWYRVAFPKSERYVPNFHNLVEPTFSDSAKSPLLQLADVVGYLLHVEDFVNTKRSEGFKREEARPSKAIVRNCEA